VDEESLVANITAGTGISISGSTISVDGIVLSLTGTPNQVNVDVSTGHVTLALPQSIHINASPTFAGLRLSSLNSVGYVQTDNNGNLTTSGSISIADGSITNAKLATSVSSSSGPSSIVQRDGDGVIYCDGITVGTISLTNAVSFLSSIVDEESLVSNITAGTGISISGSTISVDGIVLSLTGTPNQVNVDVSTGHVTLALPQSIHSNATPTFAGLTIGSSSLTTAASFLSGLTSANALASHLVAGSGISISGNTISSTGVTSVTGTDNQIIHDSTTGSITLSLPQDIHSGASPAFTGLTLSGLSSIGIIHSGVNGVLSTSLIVNDDIADGTISHAKLANVSSTNTASCLVVRDSNGDFSAGRGAFEDGISFGSGNEVVQTYDGVTSHLHSRPLDNSAMGTVLNPASYNSVMQMEDGLGNNVSTPEGTIQGSATLESGYVRLVPGSASKQGQFIYRGHPGNSFTVEYEVQIGDVTKADAIWFFFNQTGVPSNMLVSTSGLGGYALAIDVFNSGSSLADKVSLYWNGAQITSADLSTSNASLALVSNTWIRVKMIYYLSQFWVTLNDVVVPDFYPYTDERRTLTLSNNYYGVAAFCGDVFTSQDVRNVRITNPVLRAGTLTGDAGMMLGYIRLVPGRQSTYGSLVYRGHPGNSFTVEFEARIADVTKADGLWFFFNQNASESGGYRLLMDVYNSNDTSADRLSLSWNGTTLNSTQLPTNNANLALVSDGWIRVKIIFCIHQFWVTLNEWAVPGFYPYTDERRPLSLTNDYYGFTGFSGGVFTAQDVRNIRICKSNGGPVSPMNEVHSLGSGGKMVVQDSNANELLSVTSSGVTKINALNSAGVVHTNSSGTLSTSLIVNSDITAGTIAVDRLVYQPAMAKMKRFFENGTTISVSGRNNLAEMVEWTSYNAFTIDGNGNTLWGETAGGYSCGQWTIQTNRPGRTVLSLHVCMKSSATSQEVRWAIYRVVDGKLVDETRFTSTPAFTPIQLTTVDEDSGNAEYTVKWTSSGSGTLDLQILSFCAYSG
jgi:hypothetical protein